jgi:predicted outer membrane repeat protein
MFFSHPPRRTKADLRRLGPHLEALEDRTAPATLTVNSVADTASAADAYLSLREAVAIVNSPTLPNGLSAQILGQISGTLHDGGADSIVFDPTAVTGPIVLGGSQLELSLLASTATVTIDGGGPGVTVDGNNASRIFRVDAGVGASFNNLTLSHANTTNDLGGGIDNSGTLTVTSSAFSADSAGTYGGGIYNNGTLTVTNCTFSGNSAGYGGGGIENEGMLTLANSTFSVNSVSGLGGGINNDNVMTVTDCTFSGNSAATYGGGIYNFGGIVTVSNSTLSGNSANASNGGGIENATYGTLTVTNSTLSGNSAGTLGGGICNDLRATATVTSCTISGNSARTGGGISNTYLLGTVTLGNTIVAGNTGGDISGSGTFSQTYSLIGGQPRLAPLGDYGGPTQTRPLLAGSPALDAGDPAQLGVSDQRGVVRSGGVNIGAYQASASALIVTAPATATAGTPFDFTVQAVDSFAQTAVGYTGTVTFTSADPYGATVPADYQFTLADGGMHTFAAGATLYTAGNWDVTATDTVTASITGSATVAVSPAAPDHLLFLQQPTDTSAGQTIGPAVMVAVVDQFGNVLTADNNDTVTLTIGNNPSAGTLSGTLTVTVVNGIATFSDLSIDLAGGGYTLHASATGLTNADSGPFTITA